MPADGGANGVCAAAAVGTSCLCATDTDCAPFDLPDELTSCAPYAVNDVSSGSYVCKKGDSLAWDGCTAEGACPTGYSCWDDSRGNTFCARSCVSSATCGNPGGACCYGAETRSHTGSPAVRGTGRRG
jgi:hypothetical protein